MADYNLPSGYTITLSDDGLSKLAIGAQVLGSGISQLIDGNWWYRNTNIGSDKRTPPILSKTVTLSASGASVTHTYGGFLSATVLYVYTISGNDVHVTATVYNTGSTDLQPGFQSVGLRRASAGTMTPGFGWDQNNTQANGETFAYPSFNVPLAAGAISVPSTAGPTINAAAWAEGSPNQKVMNLFFGGLSGPIATIFFDRVPPGGSRVYKYAYRFDSAPDYQTLLNGYKTYLRNVFQSLPYTPDARPIVQWAAIDQSFVNSVTNPYGYRNGNHFDQVSQCTNYVNGINPPMADVNYQGIIFWQPQGIHPRGVQYRPDFNSFPDVTIPNLPTLFGGITGAGKKLGLLSRPKSVVVSTNSESTDGLMTTDGNDNYITDLKFRLDWAIGQNVSLWYLDSFVDTPTDHDILAAFRTKVGNAPTFTEHVNALSMAYSGSYEELTWSGGLVRAQIRLILDWLYPERIVLGKFQGSLPPGGYPELYTAMADQKITPLTDDPLPINNPSGHNAALKAMVLARIGPDNRWL